MPHADPITVRRADIEVVAALIAQARSAGEPACEAALFAAEMRLARLLREARHAR